MTAIPATLRLRREGALRSRAMRGDAAAFAAVYERHHQALYRYCRSILRHEEDAQDALQSTFARAFAALQDERRDFELRPWLFRIAHNEAISILRRRPATDELGEIAVEQAFEDRIAEREELRLLALDLADLPERQRAALVLRELNGLSHAEIGVVLELSPGAVKQAIFEARSALFSCREGREMDCHEIRRMLSDGDGRVLRGRGIRSHLRSCNDCRRFREDLEQRPRALRALVPPLPMGVAATLLAELVGAGTAAKLLACVAIAGGGATLAVELRDVRPPPPVKAEAAPKPQRDPKPPRVVVPPVATSEPQPTPTPTATATTAARERKRTAAPPRERKGKRERPRRARPERAKPVATVVATPTAQPERGRAAAPKANPKPKPAKPAKTPKPVKENKPEKKQAEAPASTPAPGPPEHANNEKAKQERGENEQPGRRIANGRDKDG